MKKAYLFSADVLVAVSILLLLAVSMSALSFTTSSHELEYERLYYIGKDAISIAKNTKMEAISDFPVVRYYFDETAIDNLRENKMAKECIINGKK